MRAIVLSAALVLGLAAPQGAMAQAGNTMGLVDLPGMPPKETSPVKRLPKTARDWIAAERERQAANPTPLVDTVLEIEENLNKEILKVAERERIDTHDLIMVILYDIIQGAAEDTTSELRKAERRGAPDTETSPLRARSAKLEEMVQEVIRNQSVLARQMSGNI